MNSEIDQKMQKIKELHKKKSDLFDKLERSLAMQKIWPEAFDHGSIKSHVEGSLNYPKEIKLVIVNGTGERREILLKDAPRVIRDVHVPLYGEEYSPFVLFFERLNKKEEDREQERSRDQLDQAEDGSPEGADQEG